MCIKYKVFSMFLIHIFIPLLVSGQSATFPPANTPKTVRTREVIVVTGNFSIDGQLVNIAEYDPVESRWTTDYLTDLYLYGESNGVVWDIAVNKTDSPYSTMFVVGAFDTVSETSQIQYCSVGQWDGIFFDKVGEGLCPRGSDSSTTVQLQTVALGNGGDIFVGGTFESRVWDGRHFVRILHVAHFDSAKVSWLPLKGGELRRSHADYPRVNALAWDKENEILYLGGTFDLLDDTSISSGLAMWKADTGLISFPGGGLRNYGIPRLDGIASHIAYEPNSQSLFVTGEFQEVGGLPCNHIAVWYRHLNTWKCLFDPLKSISPVTTMFLDNSILYTSGWASSGSDWYQRKPSFPYAIATLDISGYIKEKMIDRINDSDDTNSTHKFDDNTNKNTDNSTNINSNNNTNNSITYKDAYINSRTRHHRYLHNSQLSIDYYHQQYHLQEEIDHSQLRHYSAQKPRTLTQQNILSYRKNEYQLHQSYSRHHKWHHRKSSLLRRILKPITSFRFTSGSDSSSYLMSKNAVYIPYIDKYSVTASRRLVSSSHVMKEKSIFDIMGIQIYPRDNHMFSYETINGGSSYDVYKHDTAVSGNTAAAAASTIISPPSTTATSITSSTTSTSSSSSSNTIIVPPIITLPKNSTSPTQAPTILIESWSHAWKWLPGFMGGNGPILQIARGYGIFEDNLFIVGAFNNYPSIIIWSETMPEDQKLANLNSPQALQGLVTSVVQMRVKYYDIIKPSPNPNGDSKDFTFLILISCVLVGVFLGISFAFGCRFSSGYVKIPQIDIENQDDTGVPIAGIPLKTLSGDYLSMSVDFKECFERAMKARHLPTHESLLVINPREIVLSRIIGEGSFGRVWSGQWRNSSVAVKEFVFAQAAIVGGSIERNKLIEEIVGEAGIMACLRHPKILQLYGCSLTMQAIWIVSELCIRGSLRAILNDEKVELSLIRKLTICLDIADGMMYLHTRSPPIIHRDLKSQNIFITEPSPNHFIAKIGDWGSARAIALSGAKSMTHGVGTACWLAPEVINYAHFSKDSDVYAYGIVLWEIFTRQEVYEGYSAAQIISKVAHEGLRPRIPPGSICGRLMSECWNSNPSERPGFHRILKILSKLHTTEKTKVKNMLTGTTAPTGIQVEGGSSYNLLLNINEDDEEESGKKFLINEEDEDNNIFENTGNITIKNLESHNHRQKLLLKQQQLLSQSSNTSSMNVNFNHNNNMNIPRNPLNLVSNPLNTNPNLRQYNSLDSCMYYKSQTPDSMYGGGGGGGSIAQSYENTSYQNQYQINNSSTKLYTAHSEDHIYEQQQQLTESFEQKYLSNNTRHRQFVQQQLQLHPSSQLQQQQQQQQQLGNTTSSNNMYYQNTSVIAMGNEKGPSKRPFTNFSSSTIGPSPFPPILPPTAKSSQKSQQAPSPDMITPPVHNYIYQKSTDMNQLNKTIKKSSTKSKPENTTAINTLFTQSNMNNNAITTTTTNNNDNIISTEQYIDQYLQIPMKPMTRAMSEPSQSHMNEYHTLYDLDYLPYRPTFFTNLSANQQSAISVHPTTLSTNVKSTNTNHSSHHQSRQYSNPSLQSTSQTRNPEYTPSDISNIPSMSTRSDISSTSISAAVGRDGGGGTGYNSENLDVITALTINSSKMEETPLHSEYNKSTNSYVHTASPSSSSILRPIPVTLPLNDVNKSTILPHTSTIENNQASIPTNRSYTNMTSVITSTSISNDANIQLSGNHNTIHTYMNTSSDSRNIFNPIVSQVSTSVLNTDNNIARLRHDSITEDLSLIHDLSSKASTYIYERSLSPSLSTAMTDIRSPVASAIAYGQPSRASVQTTTMDNNTIGNTDSNEGIYETKKMTEITAYPQIPIITSPPIMTPTPTPPLPTYHTTTINTVPIITTTTSSTTTDIQDPMIYYAPYKPISMIYTTSTSTSTSELPHTEMKNSSSSSSNSNTIQQNIGVSEDTTTTLRKNKSGSYVHDLS